ncbi:MAG: alpha/beta fold hydrolase [Tatlockia sp.]|nr:alpha/beta fold hydrolase [Tatlockia sp.]
MHFLLIHGSWHGAWCWKKLTPFLSKNHHVTCLELPGSGQRFGEIDQVTLPLLTDTLRQFLTEATSPVTVIAHSFAGLLIAQLAECFDDIIHHSFYLAAWLPREGYSLVDMAMEYNNSELPTIFKPAEKTNWLALDPIGAKTIFYHDCNEEDQNYAAERLKPKNSLPDQTKLSAVKNNQSLAKSTYIICSEDKVIKPSSQLDMAIRFGFTKTQCIDFPSGHSPFLAKPELLSKILLESV